MLKALKWLDSRDGVVQTLAWVGAALIVALLVALAGALTGTPTFDGKSGSLWVLLVAGAGVSASRFRNRDRTQ